MSEELPEMEYVINWFGIGSDLVQMLKDGLSPIQCMKRLRQKRLREFITRCKDCKYLWTTCGKHYCDLHYASSIDLEDFCSRAERKEND